MRGQYHYPEQGHRLFTPGPITTRQSVRKAALHDFGSRDSLFRDLTAELRVGLLRVVDAPSEYVAVPLQGSGTFAVEAMLGSIVPRNERILILSNGTYGDRMYAIARRLGLKAIREEIVPERRIDVETLANALRTSKPSWVAMVHCETSTGMVNCVNEVAHECGLRGLPLMVDAMSSFGGIPFSLAETRVAALAASSNKCLEGLPGCAFVLAKREALSRNAGLATSTVLDLAAQLAGFEDNGDWRFTPPTQVVAALVEAIRQLFLEGGVGVRNARYTVNKDILLKRMAELGFSTYLNEHLVGSIIVCFRDPNYVFPLLYESLLRRGFSIYPSSGSVRKAFRIGCIGNIGPTDVIDLCDAIEEVCRTQPLEDGFRWP